MADYFRQRGGTGKRRLLTKKNDRPTELDQADVQEAAQAAQTEYDKWLYETHLHQPQHNTQSNNPKKVNNEQASSWLSTEPR